MFELGDTHTHRQSELYHYGLHCDADGAERPIALVPGFHE